MDQVRVDDIDEFGDVDAVNAEDVHAVIVDEFIVEVDEFNFDDDVNADEFDVDVDEFNVDADEFDVDADDVDANVFDVDANEFDDDASDVSFTIVRPLCAGLSTLPSRVLLFVAGEQVETSSKDRRGHRRVESRAVPREGYKSRAAPSEGNTAGQ